MMCLRNKLIKVFFTGLTVLLLGTSCEIGLGEALDLEGPSISLESPSPTAIVQKDFVIKGSASDNEGVTELTVSLAASDYETLQYKWNGVWQYYENGEWKNYSAATFTGDAKKFDWTLPVNISGTISKKEFTLTTAAKDASGAQSKNSKDERLVTVDGCEPSASVSIDKALYTKFADAKSLYNLDKEAGKTLLHNNTVLEKLVCSDFSIMVNQKENTRLGKFILVLDEIKDLDGSSATVIPSLTETPDLTSVSHDYVWTTDSSSRSFEVSVNKAALSSGIQSGKHLLRVITESFDEGGNLERKLQGFFIYYDEADIPWTEMSLGDTELKTGQDEETQKAVYPSCLLQGNAYDNDGLKSIDYELWVYENDTWKKDENKSQTVDLTSDEYPKSKIWSLYAISDTKHFKVISKCTDKKGNVSEKCEKYFRISNVNPPKLTINSPVNGNVVLGDSSGSFNIKGSVESADNNISMKIVRIANKNKDKDDYLKYFDGSYEGWENEINGNKLYSIALSGTGVPSGGFFNYTFDKQFNILTDFGVNGTGIEVTEKDGNNGQKEIEAKTNNELSENIRSHTFIIKVKDNNGAIEEELSLQGDVEKPSLTIDKVHVVHEDNSETVLSLSDANKILTSYKRDTHNQITDKVYYTGTWNDNLVQQWNSDTTKIGKLYLYNSSGILKDKNGNQVIIDLSGSQKDGSGNYVWQTEKINPEDSTTVNIQALLCDWGGNTTKTSANYFVSSCPPVLVRINSENSAGTYKKNDEIIIVMEYNKKVTFSGGSSNPSLTLNNKGTAKFVDGNGSSKHRYKYVVGENSEEIAIASELSVSAINVNNNKWVDSDSEELKSPSVLTGYNLNEVRKIYIDNDNPRVEKITPVTGSGYYRAGKELYFQAKLDKTVTVTDLNKVKLTVNIQGTGSGAKTQTVIPALSMPSSDSVLFKYEITAGDNSNGVVKFVSFEGGTDNIKDTAGNSMINFTPEATADIENGSIHVDTAKPAKPVVTGIANNKLYYSDISLGFSNFEASSSATRYYSLDKGNSWVVYTGGTVKISQNGTYGVCAKQVDLAGNESEFTADSDSITVSLDKGNLLTSISSSNPDGTYKNGDTLDLVLTFRKTVTASGIKLNLNIVDKDGNSLSRQAALTTTTASKQLHFTYSVVEADFCSKLNVTSISYDSASIKDEYGTVVASSSVTGNVDTSSVTALTEVRSIKIVNGKPKVVSVALSKPSGAGTKERELRITFNSEITKQSETKTTPKSLLYITLKQSSGFEAPAVLTESQYNEYPAAVKAYYKETTNGWNSSTKLPDLSTKYVLNYEYDTDNETLVNGLKGIYKAADNNTAPDTVPVPMGSNYVKVDSSDKTVLVISLKDDYELPVQGAVYSVTIPAEIVENNIGERNEAAYSSGTTNYSVTNSGIETPVIRVNRKNESISGATVTQYMKTTYKVDCQTPGVTLNLRTKELKNTYLKLIGNGGDDVIMARNGSTKISSAPAFGIEISDLSSAGSVAKKAEKEIGTSLNSTTTANTGYKILIEATAVKNGVSSSSAYEAAMRTIIIYYENNNNNKPGGDYENRWIRGGDNISGGVSTSDFPLSWDSSDWNKTPRHVRAMTSWSTNNTWYWVSWNINTTAYVHFLAGDMPSDAESHGPSKWWWSSCGWVPKKSQTPVYAGECSIFETSANSLYGGFNYLSGETDGDKHRESR